MAVAVTILGLLAVIAGVLFLVNSDLAQTKQAFTGDLPEPGEFI